MLLFDFLPTRHDSGTSPNLDVAPHRFQILVVDTSDILCMTGECKEIVALEFVVVVSHCICEATDDGFGNGCESSQYTIQERL